MPGSFFFLQTLRSLETIKTSYSEMCHESKAKISRRQGSHSSEILFHESYYYSEQITFLSKIGDNLEVSQEKCICLVPRPHFSARPKRFGSRGPSEVVSFPPVHLGYVTEVN